jgi:AcrR family transcriptional regulator
LAPDAGDGYIVTGAPRRDPDETEARSSRNRGDGRNLGPTEPTKSAKPPNAPRSANATGNPGRSGGDRRHQSSKPHGREEIIESVIDATLTLWREKGTAELSLRSIAARADVNYGLVHRHFRTKEAVIRAAMDRVVTRSLGFIEDTTDLMGTIEDVLPRSTGAHARLLAWTILQYVIDEVLPDHDVFLERMRQLVRWPRTFAGSADRLR